MASVVSSDPTLVIVFWIAAGLFAASLACLLLSLLLRWQRQRETRHHEAVAKAWRPMLYGVIAGEPLPVTHLPAKDWTPFCLTWLRLYEQVKGSSQEALIRALHQLDLRRMLLEKLQVRKNDDRLLALLMLGAMRDRRAIVPAQTLIDSPYDLLSSVAARTLLRIEPELAVPALLQQLGKPGWSVPRLMSKLIIVPSTVRKKHLVAAVSLLEAHQIPELLALIARVEPSAFDTAASMALERLPNDLDILIKVLTHTQHPAHLKLARLALYQRNPKLVIAALAAYRSLGSKDDLDILKPLLDTQDWEVSRALVSTIVTLPGLPKAQLIDILNTLPDPAPVKPHLIEKLHDLGWLKPADKTALERVS